MSEAPALGGASALDPQQAPPAIKLTPPGLSAFHEEGKTKEGKKEETEPKEGAAGVREVFFQLGLRNKLGF